MFVPDVKFFKCAVKKSIIRAFVFEHFISTGDNFVFTFIGAREP